MEARKRKYQNIGIYAEEKKKEGNKKLYNAIQGIRQRLETLLWINQVNIEQYYESFIQRIWIEMSPEPNTPSTPFK